MAEEKVLFEMRVTEDAHGAHVEIHESWEWKAYHRARREAGPFAWLERCGESVKAHVNRARQQELRRTLESLQGLYNEVYGQPAE
jgi:hypothetical protein